MSLVAQALEDSADLVGVSFPTSQLMQMWVEMEPVPTWLPEKLEQTILADPVT